MLPNEKETTPEEEDNDLGYLKSILLALYHLSEAASLNNYPELSKDIHAICEKFEKAYQLERHYTKS